MLSLRRLEPQELEEELTRARKTAPTYKEVGGSRDADLPAGFHHVRLEERIGDATIFERAVLGLRSWVAHEGAGLGVYPHDFVAPEATVLLTTSIGPVHMVAPCRIVAIFEDRDSFGFSYGTLPGHPENGEESFALERRDGNTYFSVTAFSRAAERFARLAGPVGRAVQRSVTRRYIKALRRYASSGVPTP